MPKPKSKKTAFKSAAKPAKKSKPAVKTAKRKPAKSKKATAVEVDVALGRPLVTQEEKLYLLFKEDYHARQIFEFLRVATVRDLEQYSPLQISRILAKPLHDTIDRIRQRLAEMKRSLRDDEDFAAEYRKQTKGR
ncbi:MAG: hypothetical protein HZA46_09555 [Planctomycetales bacterium]|nr:hypothetical protein [Planctomycetales bacterium]